MNILMNLIAGSLLININMRCIEMQAERLLQNPLARLTLT